MCARLVSPEQGPSSGHVTLRFGIVRKPRAVDISKETKAALDLIIRPSLHICKLAFDRSVEIASKVAPPSRFRKNSVLSVDASISSDTGSKKQVRFDDQPLVISRKGFFRRRRRVLPSSPAKPCLLIRKCETACQKSPQPLIETDTESIYEDCLFDHPDFQVDLQVLEGDRCSDAPPRKCIGRSEFYETEFGVATFDSAGYADYCFSKWLDKQREDAWSQKLVFEHPASLPWPRRNVPHLPCAANTPCLSPPPSLPTAMSRPPRSLLRRIIIRIEDEIQNAIVVLIIGLLIHACLFLYLLYDVFARGLAPSDD